MPQRPPWTWGMTPQGDNLGSYLDERMADLEAYLRQLHTEVTFGPVAGAYFPVHLGRSSASGTALPTGAVDGSFFDFELRPIHLSLVCFGGNLTVDLLSESSSILSAGAVSLVGGTQQTFNERGDFAVEKLTNDITMSISSIDSGTPIHVRAVVLGKNVSKVEPA